MRGRKKSTKEANAEYLQKQGGTEVAEQKKQQEQDLNQLLKVRREKLADLQANGKDPFKIVKYDVTHHSQEIKDHFDELESQTVTIAGRMMSKRVMGKASFCQYRIWREASSLMWQETAWEKKLIKISKNLT